MGDVVLGVDIGTSSSKAVLVRPDGEVVASSSRAHRMSLPRPGWAEMDAEVDWWGDVVALCRELVPLVPPGDRLSAVCPSGIGPCLVLVGDDGRALGPAVLYGVDSRASAEVDELGEMLGPAALEERCGSGLSSQALGPKLLWARRRRPEAWARARTWHGCSSFVVQRLTGVDALDHHTASQCAPLYDLRSRGWSEDWAVDVVGDLPLPRLVAPDDVVGAVTASASALTGLPEDLPVVAGAVDAWVEALGAGVRRPGDLMLMYGSTSFAVQVSPGLRRRPPLWATCGLDEGTYTLSGGTATAGSLTAWVQDLTGGASFEELVREAAGIAPGADGLLVLPYLAGERTPVFDPRARGVVAGLTLRHGRGHLYRAALEGIALGVAQVLDLFDDAAGASRPVVAVGGGTRGGLWTQITSDVTGRAQVVPEEAIGASYGAALLAAEGVGLVPRGTDWSRPGRLVEPDPALRGLYDDLAGAFASLYPATREAVGVLADVDESGSTQPGAGVPAGARELGRLA
ncbi:FGGY family carbohydrate kinase [Pseudokineococcus sp. 5B2Z-1]|uniref:FGGY-family carbohydrate kinase n=1 Tax=Pseudokineococcus sp. 5B2Z-1 TaxID=3132744 RepID=UPI00309BFA5B